MINQYGYNSLIVGLCMVNIIALLTEARPGKSPFTDMEEQNPKLCQPDRLTVYRVTLNTFWNPRNFPKHYPQWRPPAQWSKLVGRSHNKSYTLYRLHQKATEGLKLFAENGRSDYLDTQSQGEGGIYDEFNAPPITSGEGKTEADFFVDGNHSRVSLISKLVPSPDWFIGIDSLDLCVNSKWLDSISIEVGVVDAGTDNGFSFTSPNWPTEPQEMIRHLTTNFPNHPASAFFYPGVHKLPTMASFHFVKIKEYELSKVFHQNDDAIQNEIKKMEQESYVFEEGNAHFLKRNSSNSNVYVISHSLDSVSLNLSVENNTEKFEKEAANLSVNSANNVDNASVVGRDMQTESPHGFTSFPLPVVIQKTNKSKVNKPSKSAKVFTRNRPPRDCEVGNWSDWSSCSKACDIGESTRHRKVVNHARRGGRPCPSLAEKKWCGSARSCNRSYFNWS
ncbi:spondin-1-like isoform X1 [Daphnia pulicaria]|uniref:spondin-1-like isoform X1 n=1 Tax=Daphnia pulicaria TaxID=35523 RepID=UPI001EEC637B|nr:spondin-1-like isoform X1 [Daphnia pulicaria]